MPRGRGTGGNRLDDDFVFEVHRSVAVPRSTESAVMVIEAGVVSAVPPNTFVERLVSLRLTLFAALPGPLTP